MEIFIIVVSQDIQWKIITLIVFYLKDYGGSRRDGNYM